MNVSNGTRAKQVELWSPGSFHFLEIKLTNLILENLTPQDYFDIMEYLQQELAEEQRKQEEELIRAQYDDALKFEQEAADYYSTQSDPSFVLCPLCKHNKLIDNHGIIFCSCGLRLDVQVRPF